MKIICYQATTDFPSSKSYEWIGGENSKVFFSNRRNFDRSQISASLPLNLEGSERRVYLIPKDWEGELLSLLKDQYANVEWQENSSPKKPSKDEIGSGWSEELAKFYDEKVEIISIFIAEEKPSSPVSSNNEGNMDNENELESIDRDVSHRILTVFSFLIAIIVILLLLWQMTTLGEVKDLKSLSIIPFLLDKAAKAKNNWEQEKVVELCELAGSINKDRRNSSDSGKLCEPAVGENKSPSEDKPQQDTSIANIAKSPEQNDQLLKKINDYKAEAEKAMAENPPCLSFGSICKSGGKSASDQVKELAEIESPNEEVVKSEKEKVIRDVLTKMVGKYPSSFRRSSDAVCKKLEEMANFIKEKKLTFAEDIIQSDGYWKRKCASSSEPTNHE